MDERESWARLLGNLVPLPIRKSPATSNYEFATKKNISSTGQQAYYVAIYPTQEVRAEDSWALSLFADWQERRAGLLNKIGN